jgi:hypothetical protein
MEMVLWERALKASPELAVGVGVAPMVLGRVVFASQHLGCLWGAVLSHVQDDLGSEMYVGLDCLTFEQYELSRNPERLVAAVLKRFAVGQNVRELMLYLFQIEPLLQFLTICSLTLLHVLLDLRGPPIPQPWSWLQKNIFKFKSTEIEGITAVTSFANLLEIGINPRLQ